MVALGYIVRHQVAQTHAPIWVAAGWLLTAWVVLRLVFAIKKGVGTFRAHTRTGINIANLDKLTAASMQPWARGYYQIEKRAFRGTWRTLTRRPLTPAGEFSVADGAGGKQLAAGSLLLVSACAALGAVFLLDEVTAFWPRALACAGLGYALLYAAVWIIGERRSLKEAGHRITRDALLVDLGIRCAGVIALDRIAACSLIDAPHAPLAGADVWQLAPGAPANVLIALVGATTLDVTVFGSPRQISKRFVALYVDEPAAFVAALTRACRAAARAVA
ncbi:MAG: hypothetical protein QFF03_08315 [Pseudomonadota bacterium]|nr:hypothetical protein [Pseudomonadota bacterium]